MKQSSYRNRILFYFTALAATVCPNLFAANHALLIGIQDYPMTEQSQERGLQQLSGPRNDIKLMEKILSAPPLQFPEDNIKILLDKQATHSAIEQAFADLKAQVNPNDFVYIHFSGHGSERINENPDVDNEITDNDQTWVTYGASTGSFPPLSKDDRDILDDQINVWLAEIGKVTDQIVFVSDSCHSGSVSRGPKMGVRAVAMDARPYPRAASVTNDAPPIGIRIGASGDKESAYEITQNGRSYGRFTWFWSKALNAVKPGETWGDIFKRTEVLMREESMMGLSAIYQRPQIALQNLLDQDIIVLGGDFPDRGTSILATSIDNEKQVVRLNAGLLGGVTKDSIFRVYAATENPSEAFAEVEITNVTPFSSEAKIVKGQVSVGDILVESQHAYNFGPIHVVIEGDDILGHEQNQKIFSLIADQLNTPEFELVNERRNDGWIIYLLRPDQQDGQYYASGAMLPKSKSGAVLEAWVLNMQEELLDDTMRVKLSNLDQDVNELVRKMKKLADLRDLKMLNNDPPDVRIQAYRLTEDDFCNDDSHAELCFRVDNRLYRATDSTELTLMDGQRQPLGSKIGFLVENRTQLPYYVYLLSISARDGAFVQFPLGHRTSEYARINGRESKKLEGALYFPNPGQEVIKVIMSEKPLDPSVFEFAGTQQERGVTRGPQNPLERLLNRTARLRGVRVYAPDPSEWGTVQAQMVIVKEGKDALNR